jgi:hypothetical protein
MEAGDEAIYIAGFKKPKRIRVKLVRLMRGYRWNLGLYRTVIEDRWYARILDSKNNTYSDWMTALPADMLVPIGDNNYADDDEKIVARNRKERYEVPTTD